MRVVYDTFIPSILDMALRGRSARNVRRDRNTDSCGFSFKQASEICGTNFKIRIVVIMTKHFFFATNVKFENDHFGHALAVRGWLSFQKVRNALFPLQKSLLPFQRKNLVNLRSPSVSFGMMVLFAFFGVGVPLFSSLPPAPTLSLSPVEPVPLCQQDTSLYRISDTHRHNKGV